VVGEAEMEKEVSFSGFHQYNCIGLGSDFDI
jgi:hypothetical protein